MTAAEIDAMQAGPEMDRLIAENVCGWTEGKQFNAYHSREFITRGDALASMRDDTRWRPSTDLNAAVEACGQREFTLHHFEEDHDHVALNYYHWKAKIGFGPECHAKTPALALCRALLKATLSNP